jgi:hypothetical protein
MNGILRFNNFLPPIVRNELAITGAVATSANVPSNELPTANKLNALEQALSLKGDFQAVPKLALELGKAYGSQIISVFCRDRTPQRSQ